MTKFSGNKKYNPAGAMELFERLFKDHFKALHSYACSFTKNEAAGEEIVQGVFCKLWEKRAELPPEEELVAYLYRVVYNDSLNYLKHNKVVAKHQAYASQLQEYETTDHAALNELRQEIDKALASLPEQCRTVFQMSRFEHLRYKDIAALLHISEKTVENHMGRALKMMRSKLSKFLPVVAMILMYP
jgi:RNA polymerase sigma-70 factor (ECF subfamily)